jgi:hypothetical protein
MSFLNPLLLAGLATIAIPIIIHLLNKRKIERVVWAAMRFLRVSVEQNERRLRIEYLLLLILRCLMVAMLALALARPAIRNALSGMFGQNAVTAVIIVDQSYSMSQTDGTQSRFEKAKTAGAQIIDTLPSGSSAAVWMSSDAVNRLIPDPTLDLNLARATIQGAQLSARATDVAPALRAAIDLLQAKPGLRKEIYFVTDGQANGWKQMDVIQKMLQESMQDIATHFIFVTSHEDQNLGVADLRQVSGLAAADQPLRFSVKVTNFGTNEARDVRVTLKVDNDETADETSISSIPPGDSRSVSLFAKLHGQGYHTITASIPPDPLPADDNRTIVVRAVGKVKVLLVDGNPGFSARESEVFFLKNVFGAGDQALVDAKTISPADIPATNLDEFDAVILADVPDFAPATLDAFAAYLQHGGGMMIFPGDHMQESFYNQQLLGKYHFLSASFGPPQGQADAKEKLLALQDRGFENPISAIWNDPAAGSPSSASFFRITPLAIDPTGASDTAGEPHIVMKFSDGTPAVLERSWGQGGPGLVLQFASTASTRWNDLPVHPGIYVPLIYRCLGAIVGRQDQGLNILAGDKFVYHPGIEMLGKTATITKPEAQAAAGGAETKSAQAASASRDSLQIEMDRQQPTLTYDDTDVAGAYSVEIPDAPPMKFAVQSDPEESRLEDLADAQKQSLAQVSNVIEWTPTTSLEQKLATSRLGTELWLPLISIVIALAAAETFLASWFSRPR